MTTGVQKSRLGQVESSIGREGNGLLGFSLIAWDPVVVKVIHVPPKDPQMNFRNDRVFWNCMAIFVSMSLFFGGESTSQWAKENFSPVYGWGSQHPV